MNKQITNSVRKYDGPSSPKYTSEALMPSEGSNATNC